MVCPYSLSRPGGVQGQVEGLARALGDIGVDVYVVAPADDRPLGLHGTTFVAGRSTGLRANGSVAPVSLSPGAALRALRFTRDADTDLVHLHEPMAPALGYACLARSRVPLIGTYHRSGDTSWYRALAPAARWANGRLAARCAVSESAARTARRAMGGEYEVLFNGVEVERYAGAPSGGRRSPFGAVPRSPRGAQGPGGALGSLRHGPGRRRALGGRRRAGHRRPAEPVPGLAPGPVAGGGLRGGEARPPRGRRRRLARPPSGASRSVWCWWRPWRPAARWSPRTSRATTRPPTGWPSWCHRVTRSRWPRPSRGSWPRWARARRRAPAALEAGVARAQEWSMNRLAARYAALYERVLGRAAGGSGTTLGRS